MESNLGTLSTLGSTTPPLLRALLSEDPGRLTFTRGRKMEYLQLVAGVLTIFLPPAVQLRHSNPFWVSGILSKKLIFSTCFMYYENLLSSWLDILSKRQSVDFKWIQLKEGR